MRFAPFSGEILVVKMLQVVVASFIGLSDRSLLQLCQFLSHHGGLLAVENLPAGEAVAD